jgi:hypothetical protein
MHLQEPSPGSRRSPAVASAQHATSLREARDRGRPSTVARSSAQADAASERGASPTPKKGVWLIGQGGDGSSIPKSTSASEDLGETRRLEVAASACSALRRGFTGLRRAGGAAACGAPASPSEMGTGAITGGRGDVDAVCAVAALPSWLGGCASVGAGGAVEAAGSSGNASVAAGALA